MTETTTEAKTRAPGRKSHNDTEAGAAVVEGIAYPVAGIPTATRDELAIDGLRRRLMVAKDPAAAYAAIKGGTLSTRAPAKPKELGHWHTAWAHAVVDETRKSERPVTLDEAKKHAAGLTRDAVAEAKKSALVVRHYERLHGKKDKPTSLLDLARLGTAAATEEAAELAEAAD